MTSSLLNYLQIKFRWLFFLLLAKLLFTLLAVFVFARFTPLIDAELYLSGFYAAQRDVPLRTVFIQSLVTFLSYFGGAIFAHWMFGVLSLVGVIYYHLRGGRRWELLLPLLLPSSIIWTSVIGKEAIFFGFFTLALVIWARFIGRKFDFIDISFLGLAVVVCAILRPHYAVVVVWLVISTTFVIKLKGGAFVWLCLMASVGSGLVWLYAWEPLLWRGFGAIDFGARASRFLHLGIDPGTEAGFVVYREFLYLGAVFGIVGPMPSELFGRPVFIPFFLEGLLILLFPAAVYFYANRRSFSGKEWFMTIFWISLVPAIIALVIIHAPFGLLNPGSATRWRVNFEAIFHIAPLLLLFVTRDRNENYPLSP